MKSVAQFSKREKKIFYITLIVLACALFFKLVLGGMFGLDRRLTQELEAKVIALKRARQISKKGSAQKDYETLVAALKIEKGPDEEMARLFSEIEDKAKKSAVNILNIRPQEIEDKKFYKRFALELRLEGSSKDIIQFIYYLESSPLLLRIDKLTLSSRSAQKSPLNCELAISRIAIP